MYYLNGVLNLFSYIALSVSTTDERAFLATLFLFAASIALEGLSIKNDQSDVDHQCQNSAIILWCMRGLFAVSLLSISLVAACMISYMHCTFEGEELVEIFISGTGLMGFSKFNATIYMNIIGLTSVFAQWVLGVRMTALKLFRVKHCGLNPDGLWEG